MTPLLRTLLFWAAAALCLVAQIRIVADMVRPPAGNDGTARRPRAGEIAWAILPAIALAVVFVFTWRAMHTEQQVREAPASPAGAAVAITGSQ